MFSAAGGAFCAKKMYRACGGLFAMRIEQRSAGLSIAFIVRNLENMVNYCNSGFSWTAKDLQIHI